MLTVGLRFRLVASLQKAFLLCDSLCYFGDSYFADLHTRCTEQFCPSLVINRHTRDNAADASEAALEMVQLCTQVRFFVPTPDAPLMPLSLNCLRTFLKILDSL